MKKLLLLLVAVLIVTCLASCDWFETDTTHEHTYEYIRYETGHFKQYTCGCPSPDILGLHLDTDENGACDICGYHIDERIALSTQEEWLNEITPENVTQIQTIHSDFGYIFDMEQIATVKNKEDIAKIIESYRNLTIKKLDPNVCYDITTEHFEIIFKYILYHNFILARELRFEHARTFSARQVRFVLYE